jgi:hypothetical protein
MLEPEQKVVVTGEESHQPALAPWAPLADGRSRRVAAELGFVAGTRGRQVIEVRVDGRRVGTLTALMSERYAPHVHEILRRRERPGCVAIVKHGRRGLVEAELYLPDVTGIPAPTPPRPAPRGPDAGRPPAGPRRRLRTPMMIGGGVFALLLVIGAVSGGGSEQDSDAVPVVAAAAPTTRPVPTTTPALTTEQVPTASPTAEPDRVVDADRRTERVPATTRQSRAAEPEPRRAPQPEPQRVVAPEPEPEPEPAAEVYYANCDAVRAAGAAPIRSGQPGYRSGLDRDGDGQGCGAD